MSRIDRYEYKNGTFYRDGQPVTEPRDIPTYFRACLVEMEGEPSPYNLLPYSQN